MYITLKGDWKTPRQKIKKCIVIFLFTGIIMYMLKNNES